MRGIKYVTGWVTVRISGAEPERLLAALADRGVAFRRATPPADYVMTVQVPAREEQRVVQLARSVGCEAAVRARHGLPALAVRLRRRYVLMAGAALVAALLFVGSAFVWQIDIEGNETVPDGPILQALQACGVDIGSFWPAFSQDRIRNGVLLRVSGLRWMTVTVRGGRARVIVRETREHLPVVRDREYVKIVAAKAALIDEIQPLRGTAETEPGRAVLPGETLIGGYTTGRFNVQGPTRAIGRVTGRTWYELTAKCPLETAYKAPDGKKSVRWALILGKMRINFYKGSSICPAGCDKIIESWPLGIKGLFTLPVTLERTVCTACEPQPGQAPQLRETLESQLMGMLIDRIGPDGRVTESRFTATRGGGTLYVTLRAECREPIGAEVPLTEADLAEIQAMIPEKTEQ